MRPYSVVFFASLLLSVGLLATDVVSTAHAQGSPTSSATTRDDYIHTYARPGQATETVYVWGAVNQPGIWEIAPDTDIVELFSVINPRQYGSEPLRTRRQFILRVHRSNEVIHEMQLEKLLEMPPDQRPTLQAQDVLEVRSVEKRRFSLRTLSTVVGTLSSVTLLVLRIFNF